MKHLLTFLLVLLFISCESEPKQYQLSTTDVQKLEELACYLSKKYENEKSSLSFTRNLQLSVTDVSDSFYLKEQTSSSIATLSSIENMFETLNAAGIKCNGNSVELSSQQVASRTVFLEALHSNIAYNTAWRNGIKVRTIEDINNQTDLTVKLSSQMK